ncbi:MAG: hypothetical protein KJZ84_04565 [Bryobacteraceae bacterium]|nr:hypothetical protein [Bryobacteraceae bacterium]
MANIIIAVLLAYAFTALGAVILRRTPRSWYEFNQFFVIGLTAATLSLFVLSLATGGHALMITLLLLAAAATLGVRARMFPPLSLPRIPRSAILPLLLTATAAAVFTYLNFTVAFYWDGYQIWGTKALLLYERGALTEYFWYPGNYERILEYPPMIPMYEALLTRLKGAFVWESVKPIFLIFYFSLLNFTYHAASAFVRSHGMALWAVAMSSVSAAVSLHYSTGGYADMPQACVLAAVIAALGRADETSWRANQALPWLLAGLALVKSEGLVLFGVGSIVIVAAWLTSGRLMDRVRTAAGGVSISLLGPAVSILLVKLSKSHDVVYSVDWQRAATRLTQVPEIALTHLLHWPEWGFHWPFALLAATLLLVMGPMRERLLAFAGLASLAIYTSVFYFSAWDAKAHMDNAYSRIIGQLIPLTIVIIIAAHHRLAGTPEGGIGEEQQCRKTEFRANPSL